MNVIRITSEAIEVHVGEDIERCVHVAVRVWQALRVPRPPVVYPTAPDADLAEAHDRIRFLEDEVAGLRRDGVEANAAEDRSLAALKAQKKVVAKLKVRTHKDEVEAVAAAAPAVPVPEVPDAPADVPAPADPGLTLVQVAQSLHIPMTEVTRLIDRDSLRVTKDADGVRRVSREDLADFRRRYKTKGGKAA